MSQPAKIVIKPGMFSETYFQGGNYKDYKEIALVWTGRVARRIRRASGKKHPQVLDVGCAHGYLMVALQEEGCQVKGLEYSRYVMKKAERAVCETIEEGSVLDDKFPPNEFDVVVCLNVLEYIPEDQVEKALRNLVRWTSDLIFFTTCFKHSRYASQKHSPDNLRITIKTEKEWIDIFQRVGAAYKETFYDGGGGDVLVFRKKYD
jgi:2-polyprenyl-3-methyl-5-hydroxy-6-metoxy-1,4-benzoquinol methylase